MMVDWSSVFAAIAAIAAAISAFVSLCQQISARKAAADVRRINNETLWYNKIALDMVITQLNNLIDKTERNIDSCKKSRTDIVKELEIVNKELNSDINSLNELLFLLKIFDMDLFRKCSGELESIRDIYSGAINKSLKEKRMVFYSVNDVHAKKKEIVEELLQYAKIVTSE